MISYIFPISATAPSHPKEESNDTYDETEAQRERLIDRVRVKVKVREGKRNCVPPLRCQYQRSFPESKSAQLLHYTIPDSVIAGSYSVNF